MIATSSTAEVKSGIIGKVFLSLFLSIFLLVGLLFFGLGCREFYRAVASHWWPVSNARILSSQVSDTSKVGEFQVDVTFRYEFQNRTYEASSWTSKTKTFSDYSDAHRKANEFTPGVEKRCYVNPASPQQAVLEHASLWSFLMIPFSLIFVGIGGGGIFLVWRVRPKSTAPTPLSERKRAAQSPGCLAAFFSIFLLAGVGVLFPFFIFPVLKIFQARDWPTVSCRILSSEVKVQDTDDGHTYKVSIYYAYQVGGREYRSNRYKFASVSTSGRAGKESIVAQYPVGSAAVCYVNPNDPLDAVIHRGLSGEIWFGLIPLIFVGVGAAGISYSLRQRKGFLPVSALRTSPRAGVPLQAPDSIVLKPQSTPLLKLIGLSFFALFWNGIVSVFIFQVAKGWVRGRPEWFLTLFLIPFVLVGAGLIFGVFYQLLAMFNPRPRLKLTSGMVPLGGKGEVQWVLDGRVERLSRFRITFEGREAATYRQGTSSSTDHSVFYSASLVDTTDVRASRNGSVTFAVPADAMHSFKSDNNKIEWWVRVEGNIPRWPDMKDEFQVQVAPRDEYV